MITVLLSGLDLHQRILQVGAGQRIERAERLVHQQHLGLHGQGAGDADALLHAAGDFARALVEWRAPCAPVPGCAGSTRGVRCLAFAALEHLVHRQRTFSNTVSQGSSEWFWNTTARLGPGRLISRSFSSTPPRWPRAGRRRC
jgi:hypothetical protein